MITRFLEIEGTADLQPGQNLYGQPPFEAVLNINAKKRWDPKECYITRDKLVKLHGKQPNNTRIEAP